MAVTSSPASLPSEPAMIEQVITEFFAKGLHIILESRSPYVSSRNTYSSELSTSSPSSSTASSSAGARARDKWFNLALRYCPKNLDLWCQSNLDPLVVDIVLVRRPSAPEKILERWTLHYEAGSKRITRPSEIPSMYKKTYKQSTILLRSLYLIVRILPAYKLFRDLNSSGQLRPLSLAHRVSSFAEPFTRKQDAEMKQFSLSPVETLCGKLSLSVSYLPVLDDLGQEPLIPLSPMFIPDYVGSPLADPLRRFQSLPSSLPMDVSYVRQHSWENQRGLTPFTSPSPSPTYSDSHKLDANLNPSLRPEYNLPKKDASFDECWPSPPFSPLSSPSHAVSGELSNAHTKSEVISIPRHGKNIMLPLPSSPSPKTRRQDSPCQLDNVRLDENRSKVKKEQLKFGNLTLQKVLSSRKEEVGSIPGLKLSSCSSPLVMFSRSPSRLSLLDEFDDPEFACPFAPDDEDASDACKRVEPLDGKGSSSENWESARSASAGKSQDAAVGALVKMLRTAAPLRQDFSCSIRSEGVKGKAFNQKMVPSGTATGSSGRMDWAPSSCAMSISKLCKSRTTADALEELKSYRDLKESLVRQGIPQSLNEDHTMKSEGDSSEL